MSQDFFIFLAVSSLIGGLVLLGIFDAWRTYSGYPHFPTVLAAEDKGIPSKGLKGVCNVRDIAYLRTKDGKRIRRGILFRTARLDKIDPTAVCFFRTKGVSMIADFRSASEIRKHPDNLGVLTKAWCNFDVSSSGDPTKLIKKALASRKEEREGMMERVMHDLYVEFSTGPKRKAFGRFLTRLSEERSAIVHCTAGKDRTGWAVSLLLRILGVAECDIIKDYLESNAGFRPMARRYAVIARVASLWRVGRTDLVPLLGVRRRYLDAASDAVLSEFGSWDAYFRDGLGISEKTKSKLREKFLGE